MNGRVALGRHRLAVTAAAVALAALGAALALRYLLIEPRAIGLACESAGPPGWCWLRSLVVATFETGGLGLASLAAALLAHVLGWRRLAVLAVAVAAAGIVLYNAGLAAVGFVLGVIRAVRP